MDSRRSDELTALLYIAIGIASIVFGIYEFRKGDVTNALLAIAIGLFVLILMVFT